MKDGAPRRSLNLEDYKKRRGLIWCSHGSMNPLLFACAIGGTRLRANKWVSVTSRGIMSECWSSGLSIQTREAQLDDFPKKKIISWKNKAHFVLFFCCSFCIITLICWVVRFMRLTCFTPMSDSLKFFLSFFCFFKRTPCRGLLSWTEDAIVEDVDCQNVFIWLDYKYIGTDRSVHTTTRFYCKQSILLSDHCFPLLHPEF